MSDLTLDGQKHSSKTNVNLAGAGQPHPLGDENNIAQILLDDAACPLRQGAGVY
jgi:hypothetical protein